MASNAPSLAPAKITGDPRFANRYEVGAPLACGGMGVVYRAVERSTGEACAIKRLDLSTDGRAGLFLAAFEREYQTLASLEHPRIIRVFEYGSRDL